MDSPIQNFITFGAGAIGSIYGYPGMMIGLSVGAFISGKIAKGHKPRNNSDIKNTNEMTRIDYVPWVMGTAICPGQIFWFGQLSLMDNAELRAQWPSDLGTAYFSSYYRPLNSKFAICFCSEHQSYSLSYINRVFFDTKDKWNWCLWLHDLVKQQINADNGNFDGVGPIDLRCNTSLYGQDPSMMSGIPRKFITYMSYDGWFGDYSALELAGASAALEATTDNDFNFRETTALKRFPDVTAEISGSGISMTHDAFATVSGSDYRYGCKDGLHDYYYLFVFDTNYEIYQLKQVHPKFGSTILFEGDDFFNYTNFTSHSMSGSRTDEVLDRIYFFRARLNQDPVNDWVKQQKSYAKYSLSYDIFYVDRQTLQPVSLKLDEKIYIGDYEAPANSILIQSLEIADDCLLAFGWMIQDAFPLQNDVTITAVSNGGLRIYADLSGVPDGTFNDWYCRSNGPSNVAPYRKILNQTTTYIDIDKGFGILDADLIGQILHIQFAEEYEQDYVIADIGSTTTKIICNCPRSDLNVDGIVDTQIPYQTLSPGQFFTIWPAYSNYSYTYKIDWSKTEIGKTIYLTDALPNPPSPGDVFFIGFNDYSPGPQIPLKRQLINPVIPERMQNRYDYMKTYPWFTTATTEGWRWTHVSGRGSDSNKMVVLKFDKETGEYLGQLEAASRIVLADHAWGDAIEFVTDPESTIITCATDTQIHVHIACMQTATCGAVQDFIIDKASLNVTTAYSEDVTFLPPEEVLNAMWFKNPNSCGHAYGNFPVNAVYLWSYNEETSQWEKVWYALYFYYNPYKIIFAKLNNGHFDDIADVLLDRRTLYSGPLYVGWWQGSSMLETRFLAKMGLENRIFIYLNHAWDAGNYSFGGLPETWVFEPPTPDNPKGGLRCIDQGGENWIHGSGGFAQKYIGGFNEFTSTLSTVLPGTSSNRRASSYHCDSNPITGIYNLISSNPDLGGYFWEQYQGITEYGSNVIAYFFNTTSYNNAVAQCAEAVVAYAQINDKLIPFLEPRYQYSEAYVTAKPFADIVKEIMQSCMGWAALCQGKLNFIVPKQGESAEYFFGTETEDHLFVGTQNSNWYLSGYEYGWVYIDISAFPVNYFRGELGYFTIASVTYKFVIIDNSLTNKIKIDIYEGTVPYDWIGNSNAAPFNGVTFTILKKDNIKESSFTYAQKSKMSTPNRTRIEFQNRTHHYVDEVADFVSEGARFLDGYDKILTYDMRGIKRETQANRVAMQLQDYLEFVEWTCAFETDVMGHHLCAGDIIGVSHIVTGWDKKLFRIMGMEETGDDFNVKLELEEYNPYVYHDYGLPIVIGSSLEFSGSPTGNWGQYAGPIENVSIVEDYNTSNIIVGFSYPSSPNLVGVKVYRQVGSEWVLVTTIVGVPTTLILESELSDFPLDNQYLEYSSLSGGDSFPLSGYVWIGNELIGYNGVDAVNHRLVNLVRGVSDTPIEAHSIGDLITIYGTAPMFPIDPAWIGTTQTFKFLPFVYGVVSAPDLSIAPTSTITIQGYVNKPLFPESLRLET